VSPEVLPGLELSVYIGSHPRRVCSPHTMSTNIHQLAAGRPSSLESRIASRQIEAIRQSFALVEPRAEVMALVFYQRLFTLDPSLRPLFRTNIDEQGQKLMQMLGVAVALLDQPFALEPSLEALGSRHAGYGVECWHYDTVGTTLLDTLAECLGGSFTAEVKDAWSALYTVVAEAMQRGAKTTPGISQNQKHNS
jgi:hemoglobin-like flavoprotein